jgi:hypothetical protein
LWLPNVDYPSPPILTVSQPKQPGSSRPRGKPGVTANVRSKPKEIGHHLIPLLAGWVENSCQLSVVIELKTDLVFPFVLTTDH